MAHPFGIGTGPRARGHVRVETEQRTVDGRGRRGIADAHLAGAETAVALVRELLHQGDAVAQALQAGLTAHGRALADVGGAVAQAAVDEQLVRLVGPPGATGIHHAQVHAAAAAQHVDARAAVEEIARHLAGHGLRHGRDALGRHAVVPGHGQHQGRAHAQGRDPACHGIQAPAQFFQTPQTAARLGQVVQMGLGLLQQGTFQGTDKEARQGGHFHSLTIYGNLFHVFYVTSCPARRKHGPSLPV